ncbi:riboflavin synthase [Lactobacillus delbrueckii subsp. bulgaricus]
MFSGLVSGKARIQRLEQEGKTIVLTVKTFPENLAGVKIGDSIAVNGCCLTVEAFSKDSFTVTMMPQTFAKTTFKNLQAGDQVNMERSVPVGGRFDAGFLRVGLPVDFDLLSWPGSYAVRYGLCFKQGLVEAERDHRCDFQCYLAGWRFAVDQVHWILVKNEEFADTRVLHSSVFSCLKQKNKKFYLFSPGKITIIRTIPRKEKDFPP